MKEIFNLRRFGKLLLSDALTKLPKLYPTMLAVLALMPVIVILHYAGIFFEGDCIKSSTRLTLFYVEFFIVIFAAPFAIYRNANHRKKGVEFIMRPASALEKTLSMVIICSIVVPIIISVGYIAMDYLLYLLPGDYMRDSFGKALSNSHTLFAPIIKMILLQSACIFGNLLFRRAKVALTILSLIALLIAGLSTFGVIVEHTKISKLLDRNAVLFISAVTGKEAGEMTFGEFARYADKDLSANGAMPQKRVQFSNVIDHIYGDTVKVTGSNGEPLTIIKIYDTTSYPDDPDYEYHRHVKSMKLISSTNEEIIIDGGHLQGTEVISNGFIRSIKATFYLFFALMYFLSYMRIRRIKY